jgi:hypothetical protein
MLHLSALATNVLDQKNSCITDPRYVATAHDRSWPILLQKSFEVAAEQ